MRLGYFAKFGKKTWRPSTDKAPIEQPRLRVTPKSVWLQKSNLFTAAVDVFANVEWKVVS